MAHLRRGAHAGARKLGAYPWHELLCVLLALALAVYPLGFAYGQDDANPVPVESTSLAASSEDGESPEGDPAAPSDAGEGVEVPADLSADAAPVAGTEDAAPLEDVSPGEGEADPAPIADANGPATETPPESDDPAETPAAAQLQQAAPAAQAPSAQSGEVLADATGAQGGTTDVAAMAKSSSAASVAEPVLAVVKGTIPLLAIVAGFLGEDGAGAMAYDNNYDWAKSLFGSTNSLADYYDEMSQGQLTFAPAAETSAYGADGNTNKADKANDGIVHVALPEAHGDWAGEYTDDAAVATAMLSAFDRMLDAASPAVDFASFDSDNDGALSETELAVVFIVAGYETSLLGIAHQASLYSLWAHQWSYSDAGRPLPEVDGVTLDTYVAVGEKATEIKGNKVVASQAPVSLIVHEVGHILGLPDLYDTEDGDEWSDYSVDDASLMATGNFATVTDKKGNTTYLPTALDAWSRYQLGWTTPTVVTKSGVYTVSAQNSKNGYTTLLIPTKHKGEYYIIENRTFSGYDAGLKSSYEDYKNGGIVIWHIDNGVISRYLATNQVNGSSHRPGVMPLFAEEGENKAGDWVYTLDFKTSSPDASLLFWSKSMWNKHFSGSEALNLPLYGSGKKANDPVGRLLSNIRIQFITDAGPDMKIRITMPGDELPTKPKPKQASAPAPAAPVEVYDEAIPATGDELPVGATTMALASLALFLFARRQMAYAPKHARR